MNEKKQEMEAVAAGLSEKYDAIVLMGDESGMTIQETALNDIATQVSRLAMAMATMTKCAIELEKRLRDEGACLVLPVPVIVAFEADKILKNIETGKDGASYCSRIESKSKPPRENK